MVDLDASLKDIKPWPEIAEILERALNSNPFFRDLTVVLRAMTPDDRIALLEQIEDPDREIPASHDGRYFEFVFDEVDVPGRLENLEEFVDAIILDRIDQYQKAEALDRGDGFEYEG